MRLVNILGKGDQIYTYVYKRVHNTQSSHRPFAFTDTSTWNTFTSNLRQIEWDNVKTRVKESQKERYESVGRT